MAMYAVTLLRLPCIGRLAVCASLVLALAASEVAADGESPATLGLAGDWYVLIHYRDSAETEHVLEVWEDRIWRFEPKGSRLIWTEYPVPIFSDKTGRFETLEGSTTARSLGYWEPNDAQREEIRTGLRTHSSGERTKSLRGSPERGYASGEKLRAQSASIIGYSETWRIDDLDSKPRFSRDAVLGSGRTGSMQGRTQFSAEDVAGDGSGLSGRYERDDNLRGSFQMVRAGTVRISE